VLTDAILKIGH